MKTSEYLRSLPDSEVMDPMSPGVLLNNLKRFKGFSDASISDIHRERARRTQLARSESAFSHLLVKIEEDLNLPERTLTSIYWEVSTSTSPGEDALIPISEKSGISLASLSESYQKFLPKEEEPKESKPRRVKKEKQKTLQKVKQPKAPKPTPAKKNYLSEEEVQGMRLQFIEGKKVKDIAHHFSRDTRLVTLIVRNERHQDRPYLGLGVLEPRRYEREELLAMLK